MQILKQSTAVDVLIGPFVDSTDGYTAETALSPSVKLSKNGQSLAAKNDVTTPAHDADGYYNCELDATDTNTLGTLVLTVVGSATALPVRHEFMVLPANAYDALVGGSDTLQADVTQISGAAVSTTTAQLGVNVVQVSGDATAADNLEADYDGTGYNKSNSTIGTCTTNTDMVAAAPTAAAVADAVWDEARADHVGAGSFGEGVKVESLNTQAKADVNAEADTALTDYGANTTTPPTAAAIADAVWDESTTGHTTSGTFGEQCKTDIDAILADTGTDGVVVTGTPDVNVAQISGDSTAADNLEASLETVVLGTAQTGTLSTTQMSTNLTEATDDHYNGRVIVWRTGTLAGQATDITDYDGSGKILTFTAVTEAPANGDTFVIV